jgi:predicted nuclease of predicted toxin-antitoxin system
VKLLFDENLSHKLSSKLADLFPDSVHVRDIGLKSAADPVIWDYAKGYDFIIVSKDEDLHQRSFVFGYPPKVVWIRLGNCSTGQIEDLIRKEFSLIKSFNNDYYASFLILS